MFSAQLALAIQLRDSATLDTFVPGSNQLLLDLLCATARGEGEPQLHYWGDAGVGKTHLLQGVCQAAAFHGLASVFLPLGQLSMYGPRVLEGLDTLDIICLDDIGFVAGKAEWEKALFRLINEVRSSHTQLITTADRNSSLLGFQLQDLLSRLTWGPVFQLKDLSDLEKMTVLQMRARAKGLELNQETAGYMLKHYSRSLTNLCAQLDHLDQVSLAAQRRLTIAFIKSVMVMGSGPRD